MIIYSTVTTNKYYLLIMFHIVSLINPSGNDGKGGNCIKYIWIVNLLIPFWKWKKICKFDDHFVYAY